MIKIFLGGHGQKWVWPIWSQDSKIGCISRMNWWHELIFCMMAQIQKAKSYFNGFWIGQVKSGHGHLVHPSSPSFLPGIRVFSWNLIIRFLWILPVLETIMKLCMTTPFFWKFRPKNLGNGPKIGFLNLRKNLVLNFHRICSIMIMFSICCAPTQILCLEKIFLRCRLKYCQPIKLHNF